MTLPRAHRARRLPAQVGIFDLQRQLPGAPPRGHRLRLIDKLGPSLSVGHLGLKINAGLFTPAYRRDRPIEGVWPGLTKPVTG